MHGSHEGVICTSEARWSYSMARQRDSRAEILVINYPRINDVPEAPRQTRTLSITSVMECVPV